MNQALRKFACYTLTPQIIPRVRSILSEGFGFIPYAIAGVMALARLLPAGHPYLNPVNIGRFGIRHVLAQSAMNIRFRIQNLDQIIIYALVLTGTVLMMVQFLFMAGAAFLKTATAQTISSIPLPSSFAGFFGTAAPDNDIAFIIMDRIFGIPGMFGSCVAQNIPCIDPTNMSDGTFPNQFHLAFQLMLSFYSYGLLIIAAIILLYYVVTILSETILSGTPFGKRFNHVWAPLRLICAFGLLVPVSNGLNSAQYITLYVAKWGSGLGTNGWNFYLASLANASTTSTLMGDPNALVGKTQYPQVTDVLQFLATAVTCREAYRVMYNIPIDAYFVRSGNTPPHNMSMTTWFTTAHTNPYYELQEALDFGDVTVVFGHYDSTKPDQYKEHLGRVRPYCGQMTLESKRVVKPASGAFQDGADKLPYDYLEKFAYYIWNNAGGSPTPDDMGKRICRLWLPEQGDPTAIMPTRADVEANVTWYDSVVKTLVDSAHGLMVADTDWVNTATTYGWAGAAIWYNRVAEVNGAFSDAVFNLPHVTRYAEIQEWVLNEKSKSNSMVSGETPFEPLLRDGAKIKFANPKDEDILSAMNVAYKLWSEEPDNMPIVTRNSFVDAINMVFKKTGIWTFRDNEDVHPLAALTSLGRSMLINSVVSFGFGGAAGLMSIVSGKGAFSGTMSSISSFMLTVAYIGLAIGIMLYYVLPFMPFIYFFFAIVSWAKTLFEAIVGVPLWALAHLHYDGEGFPTRQSLYGYKLLLDIFIRPILIVFGLIAASVIFYALTRTLNNMFNLVTSNLSGFDLEFAKTTASTGEPGAIEYLRDAVDKLFFTVIYTLIVYMIGMSSFKLVDQIPNHIMRWLGGGVNSFGNQFENEDSGAEVASTVKQGSAQVGGETSGIVNSLTGSANKPVATESG